MRRTVAAMAFGMLLVCASHAEAQTARDSANTAWRDGNTALAESIYRRILTADSTNETALHRLALINAWAERYQESIALFDRLLRLDPGNSEARLDRARVLAWSGNTTASLAVIDSLLSGNPRNIDALQARAQFQSWAGHYEDALNAYDRILQLTPDSRNTQVDRARVLAWAEKFENATAVYDTLLAKDPSDRDALLGLANVLTLSSRQDSARAVYRRLLEKDPKDLDALRGMARAATWQGRLIEGERYWEQALALAPKDVDVMVGYAQTLRWEGRDAAAGGILERAQKINPSRADVREQMQWVRIATAPRASAGVVHETDSDHNDITTTTLGAAFRPTSRVEVRADAYFRSANSDALSGGRSSSGITLSAWAQAEPGWSASVSGGATNTSIAGASAIPALRASITTPGRYPAGATLSFARSALDGTDALIARRVTTTESSIDAHWSVAGVSTSAAAGFARFHGEISDQSSTRWSALAVASRPFSRLITLGLRARAFGFNRDLNDAYFDPDFYGLVELSARLLQERNHWSISAEGAPGIQQVRSHGDPSGSLRFGGRLGYAIRPGRTIGLTFAWSKSGLQSLSPTGGADYRYTAAGISAGWTF